MSCPSYVTVPERHKIRRISLCNVLLEQMWHVIILNVKIKKMFCVKRLSFREEHRLRVFESRVLRRIVGPKRDEVTGGW
jgi:hypothetical protein